MTQDPDVAAAMQRLEMRELLDRSSFGSPEAKRRIARAGRRDVSEKTVISKTTYTFTVLHRTDYGQMSIDEALEESDNGHAVGWEISAETVPVPDKDVPTELRALGNDGTFFDDDLQENDDV